MLNILKKTPLFKGKNTDEIKKILAGTNYTVERYKKGEQIFRIDQSANRIGILLKGHVVVEKYNGPQCQDTIFQIQSDTE
ncbi:hypothetical protein ABDB91_15890 [Desulfoscipio sp. XC116]|uniref:hypothetical protein n=1 Tax=Desulfoscipio sp. XC116 TaxID=3144975 RepID=UPI00325B59FA